RGATQVPEATRFATSVDAIKREALSAADLVCWELRTLAVRTRGGNANVSTAVQGEGEGAAAPIIEGQRVYPCNPLLWREGSEAKKAPAFAMVALPKALLPS